MGTVSRAAMLLVREAMVSVDLLSNKAGGGDLERASIAAMCSFMETKDSVICLSKSITLGCTGEWWRSLLLLDDVQPAMIKNKLNTGLVEVNVNPKKLTSVSLGVSLFVFDELP